MIRLPALIADHLQWRLPLSDDGACRLLGGLLTDDLEQATSRFTELLSDEPALLLWCVCRSPNWRADPPKGVRDIALWLAKHGLNVLQWDDASPPADPLCSSPQLQQWAELAEQSVGVSRLAARLAGDGESAAPSLFGSLHNAEAWLATCGPASKTAGTAQEAACLPNWLVQWLDDLASQLPRDPIAITVARAAALPFQRVDEGSGLDTGAGASDSTEDLKRSDRSRERWLCSRPGSGDFLRETIHKLARLQKLEENFNKVLETEKIEALQAFAYGASHEINNPLANISTRAQTLLREETDPERRRKLAVINTQAFRAHELIADVMLFARPPALSVAAVNLVELVDRVLAELAADAASQRTTLRRLTGVSAVIVSADSGHLAAALKSLCVNSLEALRLGGQIEVSVHAVAAEPQDSEGGDWAEIVVADTGPGIPPEVRRHLFDPYFSGREAGRGLGLGLSKCWRIVSQHGGQIDVDSGPQPGATFRVRLPRGGTAVTNV